MAETLPEEKVEVAGVLAGQAVRRGPGVLAARVVLRERLPTPRSPGAPGRAGAMAAAPEGLPGTRHRTEGACGTA